MKSVVAIHPGQVQVLETVEPVCGPYQALVRTELACLCNRTDSELLHGNFPGMEDRFPFTLGHESVGQVIAVGNKVRAFAVGDRVVGGLNLDLPAEGIDSGWGGFGEITVANDHAAMLADGLQTEADGLREVYEIQTRVDPDIAAEDAVLLCTWREVLGAFRDFHLRPGDRVLIFGAGPVGLSFVKLGRLFGLGWIGVVDRHESKRSKALAFGADEAFASGEAALPTGLDAVIDAAGRAEILLQALPLLRRGGSHCIYGVLSEKILHVDLRRADFNFNLLVHQWPTRAFEREAQAQLCQWIREGRLQAAPFITHRFALGDIAAAFDEVARRGVIKALIEYGCAEH